MKYIGEQMIATPKTIVTRDRAANLHQQTFKSDSPFQRHLVIAFAVFLCALCGFVHAEDPEPAPDPGPVFDLTPDGVKGYRESGMNLSEYENINLQNGNLTLEIPIATVSTDGGLSYSVSAFYNSKVAGRPGYAAGNDNYRGVENFGLGWDLRPPRLAASIGCEHENSDDTAYPDCNANPGDQFEYTINSFVSSSGASHRLISVPPPGWSSAAPDADSYTEDCDGIPPDGLLDHDYGDCACNVDLQQDVNHQGPQEMTQICYTWNEPLLRVTVTARKESGLDPVITAIVEDESGVVSTFAHMLDASLY